MHLFKTTAGIVLLHDDHSFLLTGDWDQLINQENLFKHLFQVSAITSTITNEQADHLIKHCLQPPIGTQEVWAAGVTYLRSRDARMDESKGSGGADCYQKVYEAERPELFFKALPHRVAGHQQEVYIRKDSTWSVPEPELVLYINSKGDIQAYTIGNDMSSRSIEGENPLYLPQAKMYEKSAALGPCLYVTDKHLAPSTMIQMQITRNGNVHFNGSAPISRMKRLLTELAEWLYRECEFPTGCFLMTGTCLVPPDDFTLQEKDIIDMSIDGIGKLTNTVGINNHGSKQNPPDEIKDNSL